MCPGTVNTSGYKVTKLYRKRKLLIFSTCAKQRPGKRVIPETVTSILTSFQEFKCVSSLNAAVMWESKQSLFYSWDQTAVNQLPTVECTLLSKRIPDRDVSHFCV